MPTSSNRKKAMNSLTRSWTALQVERMEMGVRNVVSSTSSRLRPSIPRWYSRVQSTTRIQGRRTTNCRSGSARSKAESMTNESRNVSAEATRAVMRMAFCRSLGIVPGSAAEPGRSSPARLPEQQVAHHQQQADENRDGIVAHVPGLHRPQAGGGPLDQVRQTVGGAVDHRQVESLAQPACPPPEAACQKRVVEPVVPETAVQGVGQPAAAA